ncbi:hypothetical protein [Ruegeria atlantica]|uniref:hypothetical protein n=1 Tax=Ruegeria atlantica TaxID=81569 RepID=UPI001479DFC7|nr:hypothetical protein [Ruegeria atlantica]
MMNSDITDALSAALEGYLRFFDTTTALGGALFGASVFLIIRAVGIIKDKDVAQIQNRGLILITGLSALVMIVLGFIAQNVALSFNVEIMRVEPFGGCVFPDDLSPTTFFMECHRKYLRTLVWIDLIASSTGILSIGSWFVLQSRSLANEE